MYYKYLVERLKKSKNTVSKWCSNERATILESLYEITNVLDIDIRTFLAYLFKRTGMSNNANLYLEVSMVSGCLTHRYPNHYIRF